MRNRILPAGLALALVGTLAAAPASAQMTFDPSVVVSGATVKNLEIKAEPAVATAADGSAFVVWQDQRRGVGGDVMANRGNPFDVFAAPRQLNDDVRVEDIANWGWQHSMASVAISDTDIIFAAWMDRRAVQGDLCPSEVCTSDLYLTRSTDYGETWSPNLRLNTVVNGNQAEPRLAVDDRGRVHVVWTDMRDISLPQIYYSRSDDGGVTWSPEVSLMTPLNAGPAWEPDIAVRGSNVYVVWSDNRNGTDAVPDFDIYATVSTNRGDTFVQNIRVSDDATGAAQRRPDVVVAADGGAVVVWEDFRNGMADPDIYMSHNPGGLGVFSADLRVNDDLDPAIQDQVAIALDGQDRPVVVFRDYRNGIQDPDVYATRATSSLPPFSFEATSRVNSDTSTSAQGNPDVAFDAATGTMVVVYEDGDKTHGGANVSLSRSNN